VNFSVSVIIPVYNRKGLVREAVASVLAQTWVPARIVVADDGSTDGLCAGDFPPHVEYLKLEHSGFPGMARNRAVGITDTPWIAFLDSDDLWHPEKLSRQKKRLEETGFSLCHTKETWNRNGRIISQAGQNHKSDGDIFLDCLKKCVIGPSTTVMSRELFDAHKGFREDLQVAEDYEFWLRIAATEKVCYCPQELIIKRAGHGEQLSHIHGQIEIFRIRALRDLLDRDYFQNQERRIEACRELRRKAQIYALGCAKRGRLKEAEEYDQLAEKLL
jgi:glycosyltransferase involved in cell wall biosynthesis